MLVVNPYLNFNGNTEAAFNFYKSVFGGEFVVLQRFKDIPSEVPGPEGASEMIMHIALPIGAHTMLMGSDVPATYPQAVMGTNFSISVSPESKAEADRIFNGLSAGGTITMPMAESFWGAYFGMCTDQFGIQWMISFDSK